MEDVVSAPRLRIEQNGPSWLEERLGKANRNTKIRAAKILDDRECHANHFSIAIDERPTRATGSGLRIVDNFVRKNVADVALSNQGTNEFTTEKLVDNLCRFSARVLDDFVHGIFSRARQNGADAGGVAEGEQGLATDRRLLARIYFQDGFFQTRQITFHHGEIRLLGNHGNTDRNPGSRVREIGCQFRNRGIQPLAKNGGKLVILPPGLRHVVIGENAAFADDKSGAEEISANFGCAAFQGINRVAITVVEWLAIRIDPAVTQRAAGSPVDEGAGYMKEAHAWRIRTDYFFRGLRLGFHAFEPACRLLKLHAKCGHVAGPGARDFLAQLIRLLLELLLLLVNIGLLKIGARAAGFRHQLLLAVSAALELGDNGESPVSFF